MRPRLLHGFAVVGASSLLLSAAACELERLPEDRPVHTREVAEGSERIINGELDNGANPWTCALMVDEGGGLSPFCTATVIGRDGGTGYAISAAHCEMGGSQYLVCTDSYNDCPGAGCDIYPVTTKTANPQYDGGPSHDMMMLTFSGATANTAVATLPNAGFIPNEGTDCEVAGYGVTNGFNQTPTNARRRAFSYLSGVFLDAYVSPQSHNGPNGGSCYGDSGGPLFVGSGGAKRIIGITSSGDENCNIEGYYGSIDYNLDWINDYMGIDPNPSTTSAGPGATASTSVGATTGSGTETGTGVGGAAGVGGGAGDGGALGSGGSDSGDDDGGDDAADGGGTKTTVTKCDCAVPGAAGGSSNPAILMGAALALGLAGRRRRNRG